MDFALLVAEGRVFVTHRRTGVAAYDAGSGKLFWEHKETNLCATGKAVWSAMPPEASADGCTKGSAVSQRVVLVEGCERS